jgi:hypothetical protein
VKIHIAGLPVKIGSHGRQLCAWCGATLFDVDHSLEMVPAKPDGSPGEGSMPWETGVLVAVDGPGSWLVPHEDGAKLPLESCAVSSARQPSELH